MILWEGPSLLDPTVPIVVIATEDENPKTGRMLFTWILRQDRPPEVAAYDGSDGAICGNCKFRAVSGEVLHHRDLYYNATPTISDKEYDELVRRTRTCYVRLSPAEGADEETPPSEVWRKWKSGEFPRLRERGRGWSSVQHQDDDNWYLQYHGPLPVRIGAYGDPAAVPTRVWAELVRYARNFTAYTHAWRTCDPELKRLAMASADTPEERAEAQALGWRTFMVVPNGYAMIWGAKHPNGLLCPATDPDPRRGKVCPTCHGAHDYCSGCMGTGRVPTTCAVCGLCRGTFANAPSIWEVAHGKNKENHKW